MALSWQLVGPRRLPHDDLHQPPQPVAARGSLPPRPSVPDLAASCATPGPRWLVPRATGPPSRAHRRRRNEWPMTVAPAFRAGRRGTEVLLRGPTGGIPCRLLAWLRQTSFGATIRNSPMGPWAPPPVVSLSDGAGVTGCAVVGLLWRIRGLGCAAPGTAGVCEGASASGGARPH